MNINGFMSIIWKIITVIALLMVGIIILTMITFVPFGYFADGQSSLQVKSINSLIGIVLLVLSRFIIVKSKKDGSYPILVAIETRVYNG